MPASNRLIMGRLRGVMRLVGLEESRTPHPCGAVGRVLGMVETGASVSTAGFAIDEASLVVLFPSRSPQYPDDSLGRRPAPRGRARAHRSRGGRTPRASMVR